jgi:hypothetical protein
MCVRSQSHTAGNSPMYGLEEVAAIQAGRSPAACRMHFVCSLCKIHKQLADCGPAVFPTSCFSLCFVTAAAAAAAIRDRLVPAEVSGLAGRQVVAIAGGWRHTMALDSEGGVWAWGWNKFGQLGECRLEGKGAECSTEA